MNPRAGAPASLEPWDRRTALQTAAAMGLGLLLLILAYVGAQGRSSFAGQVGSLNLAVTGSTIAAASQASLLLRGRRALGLRRKVVLHQGLARLGVLPEAPPTGSAADGTSLVMVAGGQRRHRPTCLLVQGKGVRSVRFGEAPRDCEVCLA